MSDIKSNLIAQGNSEAQAEEIVQELKEDADAIVMNGGSYNDLTELLLDEGLDADFEFELLESLL